jgi:hypothetical protein
MKRPSNIVLKKEDSAIRHDFEIIAKVFSQENITGVSSSQETGF